MPVRQDNQGLNGTKHIQTYVKVIGIQTGIMVQQLNYHDVKRMVEIPSSDEDEVEALDDDPLAEILVDALDDLASETERCEIKPLGAIGALFDTGDLQRSLKPKLLMAVSLRGGVSVDGCLVQCLFTRDDALSTTLFTQSYCAQHGLPRFDARWGFIDVVASRKAPCGALLVLTAVLNAARARLQGVCAVAVTTGGNTLLRALNFTSHPFREDGAQRHMCYLRLPADLSFTHVKRKLHFDGDKEIVESFCWREPLSARAKSPVIGRC